MFIRYIANVSNTTKHKTGFYSIFASFGLSQQFCQRDPANNKQSQTPDREKSAENMQRKISAHSGSACTTDVVYCYLSNVTVLVK